MNKVMEIVLYKTSKYMNGDAFDGGGIVKGILAKHYSKNTKMCIKFQ